MLRSLLAQFETVQDLELAAEARYWESISLLTEGHSHGGVYLLGYTAEMLLKAACFRFGAAPPTTPVVGLLALCRARYVNLYARSEPIEGYHNPLFWAELLIEDRRAQLKPLPATVEQQLLLVSGFVKDNWTVSMRYQHLPALPPQTLEEFLEAVGWLRERHVDLWS
jgi:hypothetical protein